MNKFHIIILPPSNKVDIFLFTNQPGQRTLFLDWPKRLKICVGIARGLAYLHEDSQPRIIHRDIKVANVFLDKNMNAKIADFGLARLFPNDQSHISTQIAGTM